MFNKSEIFKRAWKFKKEFNIKFSDCLKKAWSLAKNTLSMTGTEKQKTWASDILNTIKKCVEEIYSSEDYFKVTKENQDLIKMFNENIIYNIKHSYAGEVIDCFKNVENFKELYMQIKIIAKCGGNYGKKDWRYKFN